MKQPKDKYEHITKTAHIQWTVMHDKEKDESKATFYVLDPAYNAHPWMACSAVTSPAGRVISIFSHQLDRPQTDVLARALGMAAKWVNGRPLPGTLIALEPE
jgi:hypothetical protein